MMSDDAHTWTDDDVDELERRAGDVGSVDELVARLRALTPAAPHYRVDELELERLNP